VLLIALIQAVVIYNGLVRLKNNVGKAWSNIDVILKQRHDELPKLVETCQQYMKFEQDTLEKVMKARTAAWSARESGDVSAVGAAEGQMRGVLGNLFALVENYPDLKANQSFLSLQSRITGLENTLSDRRELYNESVNLNNTRLEQFPDLIMARFGNFQPFSFLKFDAAELQDVNVKQLFQS
jgi:LemA protein